MKFATILEAFGSAWTFRDGDGRQSSQVLTDTRRNTVLAQFGWASLNRLSEVEALADGRRFHARLDGAEVDFETRSVYPFGGEGAIERNFVLRDGLMEVCVDVKPGRGEAVRDFELETVTFPGDWVRVELVPELPAPGGEWNWKTLAADGEILYESAAPFALLLLTAADGFQVELGAGCDWWRLTSGGIAEADAWQIRRDGAGIHVRRRMIAVPAETQIERRAWRFNYYLAWSDGRKREALGRFSVLPAVEPAKEAGSDCRRAPAVRKWLRKLLRRAADGDSHLELQLAAPTVCDDAGHLERPGKQSLRHWDLDEIFALYAWGNRQAGSGRVLKITLPETSCWKKMPSGRYLENTPPGAVGLRDTTA